MPIICTSLACDWNRALHRRCSEFEIFKLQSVRFINSLNGAKIATYSDRRFYDRVKVAARLRRPFFNAILNGGWKFSFLSYIRHCVAFVFLLEFWEIERSWKSWSTSFANRFEEELFAVFVNRSLFGFWAFFKVLRSSSRSLRSFDLYVIPNNCTKTWILWWFSPAY